MPRLTTRDNKASYNNKMFYGPGNTIRVPSLKRSDRTWRNFYRLFPFLQGEKYYYGSPLKKLKWYYPNDKQDTWRNHIKPSPFKKKLYKLRKKRNRK